MIRLPLRIAAALGWMVLCVAGFLLFSPFGAQHRWSRAFLRGVGRIAGLDVRVEGRPEPGPVLWAANHVSWLDILALGGLGAAFVAKAEVRGWPLLGGLARLGGTVFVSREQRSKADEQARAVGAAFGARPVVLFAEGTTGDGRTVLPFRPSLFAAAVQAGVPVQPVALRYAEAEAIGWTDEEPFGANAKRVLRRQRTALVLRFLPPIAPGPDRKALAAGAQAAVAASLGSPPAV